MSGTYSRKISFFRVLKSLSIYNHVCYSTIELIRVQYSTILNKPGDQLCHGVAITHHLPGLFLNLQ